MSTIKKFLNLIFIDGLSGMALGLFSTLIIGTILKQAADLIGGDFGYYLGVFAVMAQRLTADLQRTILHSLSEQILADLEH